MKSSTKHRKYIGTDLRTDEEIQNDTDLTALCDEVERLTQERDEALTALSNANKLIGAGAEECHEIVKRLESRLSQMQAVVAAAKQLDAAYDRPDKFLALSNARHDFRDALTRLAEGKESDA